MAFTLLSGVVRNRKVSQAIDDPILSARYQETNTSSGSISRVVYYVCKAINRCKKNKYLRNISLRVHKFKFKWDLVFHLSICLSSLIPFAFTGNRIFAVIPLSIWLFYNILFMIGTSRANSLVPGFGRFKHAFTASIEEFFSAKLLPVISISFLLVVLLLSVTGRRLGGPPLCYSSCRVCLAKWSASRIISPYMSHLFHNTAEGITGSGSSTTGGIDRTGCGYLNGKELLSYYTISQTSYILFVTVLVCMAVCMAWRVADEELSERQLAEEWLKREDSYAFQIRDEIMKRLGMPGSYIRPEDKKTSPNYQYEEQTNIIPMNYM